MTATTTTTAQHDAVRAFNDFHPIGTPVRYWKGAREGDGRTARTRTTAQLLGGHTAVVWLDGVSGCIALTHIQPIDETELIPDQPDGIEDDSRDLPDPHCAAERVGEYIAANGDGIYDVIGGHPLYARDLEALRRAATTVAGLRSMVAELTAENARLREPALNRPVVDVHLPADIPT